MTRERFLPFSKPCLGPREIEAVCGVLQTDWITTGPKNTEFEEKFKAYTGAVSAVAMTSETSVMFALFRALGIGPGDEVITPSMTWVSLPNTAELFGARPVFVDCDRDTLMISPEAAEAAITPRTKMIVPVHFAGAPFDRDGFTELADRHGIFLLEDAAHALGTQYKGEKIGASGTAMFSFHPIKNITTGEGGMFVSDDVQLTARLRSLKFHGLGQDAYDRKTFGRSPRAQVLEPGFKFNLSDIHAVLGVVQLDRLEELNAERRRIAAAYRRALAEIPELLPLAEPKYEFVHSCHLFPVRLVTDRLTRDEMMAKLKEKNIGTGLHFQSVHRQKYYAQKYGFAPGFLPATEWNSERLMSLPSFPGMTEEDLADVITACKEVLAGV